MYEIALVNPRRRRRNKKGQFLKGAARSTRKRNPKRRKTRSRRAAVGYVSGPKRIRRRKLNPRPHKRRRRRSTAVVSYRSRRRRRNPRLNFSTKGILRAIMPAAIGAGGALALDVALGYAPLPAMLKTGIPRHVVRIAGAFGLGWLASKVLGTEKGKAITNGALTVAIYNVLKETAVKFAPSIPGLGDYETVDLGYLDPAARLGDYGNTTVDLGRLRDSSDPMEIGAYMDGTGAYMDGMGAYMSETL